MEITCLLSRIKTSFDILKEALGCDKVMDFTDKLSV